jgi:hypothetical protein
MSLVRMKLSLVLFFVLLVALQVQSLSAQAQPLRHTPKKHPPADTQTVRPGLRKKDGQPPAAPDRLNIKHVPLAEVIEQGMDDVPHLKERLNPKRRIPKRGNRRAGGVAAFTENVRNEEERERYLAEILKAQKLLRGQNVDEPVQAKPLPHLGIPAQREGGDVEEIKKNHRHQKQKKQQNQQKQQKQQKKPTAAQKKTDRQTKRRRPPASSL